MYIGNLPKISPVDTNAQGEPGRFLRKPDLSDVLVYSFLNLLFRHVANDLLFHLPALKYKKRGNAAHAVAHGSGAVAVHVHLRDFEFAGVLVRQLIYDWGNGTAGSAPSRPEVHQHWLLRLEYVLIEV